jgi:hypothetical protein
MKLPPLPTCNYGRDTFHDGSTRKIPCSHSVRCLTVGLGAVRVSFGRFTERCKTPSWCRSARFPTRGVQRGNLKTADMAAAHTCGTLSTRRRN